MRYTKKAGADAPAFLFVRMINEMKFFTASKWPRSLRYPFVASLQF